MKFIRDVKTIRGYAGSTDSNDIFSNQYGASCIEPKPWCVKRSHIHWSVRCSRISSTRT